MTEDTTATRDALRGLLAMVAEQQPSAEEFARRYAQRSGLTVEELHQLGYRVAVCTCGADNCKGWQMLHGDSLQDWLRATGGE